MTSRRAYMFPGPGTLVVDDEARELTVIGTRDGSVATVEGALAGEVAAAIEGGEAPARLRALAGIHPAAAQIASLLGARRLPADPATALRLDGYDTLFLELTGQCNERCTHCYASAGPEVRDRLDLELCLEIIDDAAALGFSRLQLTGGDPLLCPFLPDLCQHARERGIPVREVYTNGLALSETLLEQLVVSGASFAFSLYSADPSVHDEVTQTPGSHRRTVRAIRAATERGAQVRVGIIAMDQNAEGLEATRALAAELGASQVAISGAHEVGRGRFFSAHGIATGNAHGAEHTGSAPTDRVGGKLCVTYRAEVVPCIFNREMILGSVRERRLRDIAGRPDRVRRSLRTRDQHLQRACTSLQCSGCRLTAGALRLGVSW